MSADFPPLAGGVPRYRPRSEAEAHMHRLRIHHRFHWRAWQHRTRGPVSQVWDANGGASRERVLLCEGATDALLEELRVLGGLLWESRESTVEPHGGWNAAFGAAGVRIRVEEVFLFGQRFTHMHGDDLHSEDIDLFQDITLLTLARLLEDVPPGTGPEVLRAMARAWQAGYREMEYNAGF